MIAPRWDFLNPTRRGAPQNCGNVADSQLSTLNYQLPAATRQTLNSQLSALFLISRARNRIDKVEISAAPQFRIGGRCRGACLKRLSLPLVAKLPLGWTFGVGRSVLDVRRSAFGVQSSKFRHRCPLISSRSSCSACPTKPWRSWVLDHSSRLVLVVVIVS